MATSEKPPRAEEILRKQLGQKLKDIRERRGLSQASMAAKLGLLAPSAVAHLERGQRLPSLPLLIRMAETMGVSADFLLGLKPAVEPTGPIARQLLKSLAEMSERDAKLLLRIAEVMVDARESR